MQARQVVKPLFDGGRTPLAHQVKVVIGQLSSVLGEAHGTDILFSLLEEKPRKKTSSQFEVEP
jgi:hypothetical protein